MVYENNLQATPTSSIFLFYSTTRVQVQEEIALYDFNAIVSSVGGSLGLFFGLSFWQLASMASKKILSERKD